MRAGRVQSCLLILGLSKNAKSHLRSKFNCAWFALDSGIFQPIDTKFVKLSFLALFQRIVISVGKDYGCGGHIAILGCYVVIKRIILVFLILFLIAAIAGGLFLVWGYHYISRDLPKLSTIDDYRPSAVSSVFAVDGRLIAEFHEERGRRYPVKLDQIPEFVRNCFLAAEDASFYRHPGIDIVGIIRAFVRNIQSGSAQQGGSTITQQVVKNLLLTREKKLTRKIKEAILSYRLEKRLSKDGILEIYLNEIYFGNNSYGVKAAARAYFNKELNEITLGEAAMLAALPKAPARLSPINHMDRARQRQRYVLRQMVDAGFINQEDADRAAQEEIVAERASFKNILHGAYYVSELRRIFTERWPQFNIDTDGLQIHTAFDIEADQLATKALRRGVRLVDKRRGWRGPLKSYNSEEAERLFATEFSATFPQRLEPEELYPALVTEVARATGLITVRFGKYYALIDLNKAGWAKQRIDDNDKVLFVDPIRSIKIGDVIEVSIVVDKSVVGNGGKEEDFITALRNLEEEEVKGVVLDQTPQLEGAMVLLNPYSGEVVSLIGGYDYQRSQFNRVTQSLRQPGSTFKPIVYVAAVDEYRYTPATIVYDTPRTLRVGNDIWSPSNFDQKYLGSITLRSALEKSRNLVSVDIVARIGIDAPIAYARRLGIESQLGRNPSIALGSSEVSLLEITRAFGVFAAKGVLFPTSFITKIEDREGNIVFNNRDEHLNSARQVIPEATAFIMAHMMKGVVERGTATRVRAIGRPVAGKTGTSNEEMDAWFVGYTPEWACGVWVGFDAKRRIGRRQTGGVVAAPIWLDFMQDFLEKRDEEQYQRLAEEAKMDAERLGIEYVAPEKLMPSDFSVPEGVDPYWVDRESGLLSEAGAPGAIYEYFIRGTEPARRTEEQDPVSYLESPDL